MRTLTTTIDGASRTFGPLLAKTVRLFADDIRRATLGEMTDVGQLLDLAVGVATASLQRVNPAITEEDVLGWIDMGNYTSYYAGAMGQLMPEATPGEPLAGNQSG